MLRTPEALVPYFLAAACILGGSLWHASERLEARVVTVGEPQVGGPFALLDGNGDTRTDRDFRGRWMMIYFGYTHCPDVCPTTLSLMSAVMDRLGGRASRVAPIFISVDPLRDTPAVMKQYLSSFGARFIGLTGPRSHVASVASEYRVYFRRRPLPGGDYAVDHSSVIYLMDPNGKFAADYNNSQSPDEIAADLKKRL
ncbi:MAG TPA: SCO family protein [Rhizomicrobium sp.]|jgi:protein SCO1/2